MISTILIACGFLGAIPSSSVEASYQSAKTRVGRDSEAHLRLALWCEANGLEAERQKHLAIAVLIEPDNATARELLGCTYVDGHWRAVAATPDPDQSKDLLASAHAEYLAKRSKTPITAEAHWRLVLWCEEHGLKVESLAHLAIVVRFDPMRKAAWKRLGYEEHNGRWLTAAQFAAEKAERDAQTKADRAWLPRIEKLRDHLVDRKQRAEAQQELTDITDPRAVPSLWRVFGTGGAARQVVAVASLGQINSVASSRALAVLAVLGKSSEVRRAATETFNRREPRDYGDLLVGLLRDPTKYRVQPVSGPGQPGSLLIEGKGFHVERVYAPPPPPNLPIFPGENITFDSDGLPRIVRHTDEVAMPFAWVAGGYTLPSRCIIPPHCPTHISLGQMWRENWKSAVFAQQQLQNEAAAVERANDLVRAANERVVDVLRSATGQMLPTEPGEWRAWWSRQNGRTYASSRTRPVPTVTEIVPLHYLPKDVAGLGFDPATGYYLRVPACW
jgi:hypothetical protein